MTDNDFKKLQNKITLIKNYFEGLQVEYAELTGCRYTPIRQLNDENNCTAIIDIVKDLKDLFDGNY